MFHQILKGLIQLGAKLNLLPPLKYAAPGEVQGELAESII